MAVQAFSQYSTSAATSGMADAHMSLQQAISTEHISSLQMTSMSKEAFAVLPSKELEGLQNQFVDLSLKVKPYEQEHLEEESSHIHQRESAIVPSQKNQELSDNDIIFENVLLPPSSVYCDDIDVLSKLLHSIPTTSNALASKSITPLKPQKTKEQIEKEKFISFIKDSVRSLAKMGTLKKRAVLATIERKANLFHWTSGEVENFDNDLSLFLSSCFCERDPIVNLFSRVHDVQVKIKARLKKLPVQYQSLLLQTKHGDFFIESPKISEAMFEELMKLVPPKRPLTIVFDNIDKETLIMLEELLATGETAVSPERCPPMFFGIALRFGLQEYVSIYFQMFRGQLLELYETKISVEQAITGRFFNWITLSQWVMNMINCFDENISFFATDNKKLLEYKKEIERMLFYMKIKRLNEELFLENIKEITDEWPKGLVAWATLRLRYLGLSGVSFYSKIPEALLKLPSVEVFVKAYEKALKEAQELEAAQQRARSMFNMLERVTQRQVEDLFSHGTS